VAASSSPLHRLSELGQSVWISTSTKDPAYGDVRYVEELIGPDTVTTMPEPTLLAFDDHGTVAPTLQQGLEDARRLLPRLAAAGLDHQDVAETLEAEGVAKFAASSMRLLARLAAKQHALTAPTPARR
jgi:transaldolase